MKFTNHDHIISEIQPAIIGLIILRLPKWNCICSLCNMIDDLHTKPTVVQHLPISILSSALYFGFCDELLISRYSDAWLELWSEIKSNLEIKVVV